jgi:PAS domain S-box-containing protein/putative nucleotidyltransferase with HDIG domain
VKGDVKELRPDVAQAVMAGSAAVEDARYRRAMLHILEDLKRERDALRSARQQWVDTVDALRDPLMVHDAQFRIVRCNRAYASRACMEIAEILGKPYWECFPRGTGPAPSCRKAVEQGMAESEEEIALESGEVFHLRCFGAGGRTPRWLAIFEDITERKRAGEALELSERRFRSLIEGGSDVIYLTDAAGNIRYRSPSAERIFGRQNAERLGASVFQDLHPDDAAAARGAIEQALRQPGCTIALTARVRHNSGEWVTVEILGRNLLDDPAVGGIILNLRDITERKAAEERIRRLNRVYAVLSGINNLIVRTRDRQQLFDAACRIAVEDGKFISAAVAVHEAKTQSLHAVAQRGAFEGFSRDGMSTRDDSSFAASTAVRAVRERRPVWNDDLTANRHAGPNRARNIEAGARSMISLPLFLDERVEGVLVLFAPEKSFFDEEEIRLLSELAGDISHALDYLAKSQQIGQYEAKMRSGLEATIQAIAAALESRDPYTAGHQRRVADLAAAIAREMGLPEDKVEGIHFGALIHDLGKIQIPAELLAKPVKLTKLEFELIKTHPQAGYDIVKGIEFPWPVAEMVHQHHERLDGTGYPQGLKGEAIALEARILAVADVVEAMASHRPYRPGLGVEVALKEIQDKRGKWFSPDAVDACLRLFREKAYVLDKQ